MAFDQWLLNRACDHENGVLLHHRIGNLAQVALLRGELSHEAGKFPVSLMKVLHNGMHGGDYLPLDIVGQIRGELNELSNYECSDARNEEYVKWFRQQMQELVEASLSVSKPIAF